MEQTFSRTEFQKQFGGQTQRIYGKWNRKPNDILPDHLGHRYILAPTLEYNIYLPRVACAPGLLIIEAGFTTLYGNAPGELPKGINPEPQTVMVRLKAGIWLYVGEYIVRRSEPLDFEDWLACPSNARQKRLEHVGIPSGKHPEMAELPNVDQLRDDLATGRRVGPFTVNGGYS